MSIKKIVSNHLYILSFVIPVTILLILFIIFTYIFSFPILELHLMEGKKNVIIEQVRTAESIIQKYWLMEQAGTLSKDAAQEKTKELLRNLRYGDQGKNYFFIVDNNLISIMHPFRKSLEGKSMSQIEDINGKKYIVELLNVARHNGEGFVTYYWYINGKESNTLPKLSYCKYFKPWDWAIGTGIFIHDVEKSIAKEKISALKLILIFITIALFLAVVIIIVGFRSEFKRYKVEKALYKSEEHYRQLFESSQDAILIIGPPDWKYLGVNNAACKLFGVESKEKFKELTPDLLSPKIQPDGSTSKEAADFYIKKALNDGSAFFEWVHQRIDGTTFNATVLISKLTLPEGVLLQGTIRDISKQLELEEQLRHSQKMDSIGKLAGGIAHDFNNFLGGIIGYSEILSEELTENPNLKVMANRILDAAYRTTSLTRKLLAFSRKEKRQFIQFNIDELIHDIVDLLKRTIDPLIKIDLQNSIDEKVILGDPGLIESAILNLCTNARDAMENGGVLTIDVHKETNKKVIIEVKDTGTGIPNDIKDKIFEPFFTTKQIGKGTGLGLSAVYGTIKDHHGEVMMDSKLGEGTVFKIMLPLAEVKNKNNVVNKVDKDISVLNVLIVEDDKDINFVLLKYFQSICGNVSSVFNGVEALKEIEEKADFYDLIVLDLSLPELNGRDTFNKIKNMNIKVIFISGFDLEGIHNEIISDPKVIGYLQKPFTRKDLQKIMNSTI